MGEKRSSLLPKAWGRKNEEGAVIIAALLILVILTVIGISFNSISNTEIQIASNQLIYQQNLYRAEAATTEAVELMEMIADPKASAPSWLELNLDAVTEADAWDHSFWQNGTGSVAPEPSAFLNDSRFVVVSEGIVSGSSLDMGSSKVHGYTIYGRCAPPNRGATVVQIGYLKAF